MAGFNSGPEKGLNTDEPFSLFLISTWKIVNTLFTIYFYLCDIRCTMYIEKHHC